MKRSLALMVLVAAACSDDDETPKDTGNVAITLELFCQKQAESACARAARCDFEVPWFWRRHSDCLAVAKDDCMHERDWREVFAAVDAGRLRVRNDAFDACLGRAAAAACGAADLRCLAASFEGTAEVGAACGGALGCVHSAYCKQSETSCARTCTERAAVGQSCPVSSFNACADGSHCAGGTCVANKAENLACASDAECKQELRCDGAGSSGACRAIQGEGGGCNDTEDCGEGLVCHNAMCVRPVLVEGDCTNGGVPCESHTSCKNDRCVGGQLLGDKCSTLTRCAQGECLQTPAQAEGTCGYGPRANGQLCEDELDCAEGLDCRPQQSTAPVCQGPGSEGTACRSGRDSDCTTGLYCPAATQRCERPVVENGDCSGGRRCATGLHCTSGTQLCQTPAAENGDCSAGRLCAEGLYCRGFNGRCESPVGDGGDCSDGRACADGLFCDSGDGTPNCAPKLAVDADCSGGESCADGLYCHDGGATQTCRPIPGVNGDCSQICECTGANVWCDGATCRAPIAQGQSCNMLPASGSCSSGVVRACATDLACHGGSQTCERSCPLE